MNLDLLTIDAARSAVQERKTSAAALAESFYAKIESDDPKIGAFLTLSKERAMAKAAEIDALAAKGEKLPPLGGVPVAIKDVMVTKGVRTTAGSKILGNYVPPYDCTAVARLEAAGAVVLGKLNCDEFAMGSSNENSAWKPVHNPRDLTRVPGGSSGGSAAAVAADMVLSRSLSAMGSRYWPSTVCCLSVRASSPSRPSLKPARTNSTSAHRGWPATRLITMKGTNIMATWTFWLKSSRRRRSAA